MSRYRNHPQAIQDLIRTDQVHADVYIDPELFALEQELLFSRTWQYVGHVSQVSRAGDFYTTTIAGQQLAMVRQADASVSVVHNRCAHKGATLLSETSGNTGKAIRCPYHAWTYKLDGALISMPLRAEYEDTNVRSCPAGGGLAKPAMRDYRGFVFVRLSSEGPDFETYAGGMLAVLDNLADRSPDGEIAVVGGCIRSTIHCNWKMYLENVNDAVHAISTHESVVVTAQNAWDAEADHSATPMALEQLLPFGSGLDFVRGMGARVLPNGHSILGTKASLHTAYQALNEYEAALTRLHGPDKAKEVLAFAPQNAILFPSLALKCSPQLLRVVRPVSVDRIVVEVWALQLKGAPSELLERTLHYNRLVYSPMSPVAHDDIHVFEGMQRALHSRANPWVSLHRLHRADEGLDVDMDYSATSEILMRNQFRAWARWMQRDTPPAID